MEEKIEISVKAETSGCRIVAFSRRVLLDGKEIYADRISPARYCRGKDILSQFIASCEADAGYRCDIRKLLRKVRELQYHKDTTVGLWCIDRDPKTVSKQWIDENAFQL